MNKAAKAMTLALVAAGAGLGRPSGAVAAPLAPEVYAVVVGHNGGRAGLPALRFADDDAIRFWYLLSGLAGGPEPAHVTLLTTIDAETRADMDRAGLRPRPHGVPTRAAVLGAIEAIGRTLGSRRPGAPPALFYFIYAGHGLAGRILLAPEGAGEAALTGHELRAAVAALAQVSPGLHAYVFLDACRSQSLFTERGATDDDALGPDLAGEAVALEARVGAAAIGVLTAAFSGRPTGEVRALGAGYFSHVLASGLAGAADANGDQLVSFAELAAFVAYNTDRLTAERPWFSPPDGDMRAPVVDLRGGHARMELSGAPPGRYLVQAQSGRPIFVEAVKAARQPLRLTLPAGRYRVVRAADDEHTRAATADVELASGVPLDLATSAWSDGLSTPATATAERGDDDDGAAAPVFGSAFTSEAVATLTAAYHSGREPPLGAGAAGRASSIGLAFGAGSAPIGLSGVEPAAALRYRRRLGALGGVVLGARLSYGQSSHSATGGYRLERTTALLDVAWRWLPTSSLELVVGLGAGGGPLVRRQAGSPLSGDPFVPTAAAEVAAAMRVGPRWSVLFAVRATSQWVSIDGARTRTTGIAAETGLGWHF